MRRVLLREGGCQAWSRSARTAGFTLIEVLVATFIFALVLASLFGTWKVIARSTESALHITAEQDRAIRQVNAGKECRGSTMRAVIANGPAGGLWIERVVSR